MDPAAGVTLSYGAASGAEQPTAVGVDRHHGRMTPDEVMAALVAAYPGLVPKETWGETSLFYNPGRVLASGTYFATVKEHDGENDRASELDRDGVFRVSFGLAPATYARLFGPRPPRPAKGQMVQTGHDFTAVDELTPHPVYAWMGWVQILSPAQPSWETLRPLLDEAHGKAKAAFDARIRRSGP